jgi:very-short-patch-repair endonuclease
LEKAQRNCHESKKQVHLFTSLRSSDIRITPGSQQGVVALKNYLEYLETGNIPEWGSVNPNRGTDSSFEIAVAHALNQRGYKTAYQVGVAGFFIDIGVYHPEHDGEFILGIECDGATYHSAKSVRDRDILRQSILESKGWNIHRIWSTDWFKSRDSEIGKVLGVLDDLLAATSAREKPTTKEDLKEDYKPEHVAESVSDEEEADELRAALIEFRKEKIEPQYPNLNITILSDEWIERFIEQKPTTPGDFFMFPLEQREMIKNGSQYLGDILELIGDFA